MKFANSAKAGATLTNFYIRHAPLGVEVHTIENDHIEVQVESAGNKLCLVFETVEAFLAFHELTSSWIQESPEINEAISEIQDDIRTMPSHTESDANPTL